MTYRVYVHITIYYFIYKCVYYNMCLQEYQLAHMYLNSRRIRRPGLATTTKKKKRPGKRNQKLYFILVSYNF